MESCANFRTASVPFQTNYKCSCGNESYFRPLVSSKHHGSCLRGSWPGNLSGNLSLETNLKVSVRDAVFVTKCQGAADLSDNLHAQKLAPKTGAHNDIVLLRLISHLGRLAFAIEFLF